jgi:hypothetical protein
MPWLGPTPMSRMEQASGLGNKKTVAAIWQVAFECEAGFVSLHTGLSHPVVGASTGVSRPIAPSCLRR